MQIFNFENFKKGDWLGDTKRPDWFGPTYYSREQNQYWHIEFGPLNIGYRTEAGYRDNKGYKDKKELNPKDFGVEAICYCTGKFGDEWEWDFMCTPEFFEKNKNYILKHIKRKVDCAPIEE